jgi:hypothetical protein
MFGSEVIDVGIGMSLLFLFMSLITSALRELIENAMKTRAKDLEKGIMELLQERTNTGLTKTLYEHPLITSLYQGNYAPGSKGLPTYIPRQSFSLAALDMVGALGAPGMSLGTLKSNLSAVASPNPLQKIVLTAIGTAQGDLDKVRKTIEDWYDGTMDRVSGWYTRRTGRYLAVIGLLAAVLLNVDAITVVQRLVQDKALRQAVVAQADKYVTPGTEVNDKLKELQSATFKQLHVELDQIGLPIGWHAADEGGWRLPYPAPQMCPPASGSTEPTCNFTWGALVRSVLGWMATALAIMLGAPFWFDVLNKFMIVRSTIKKPGPAGPAGSYSDDSSQIDDRDQIATALATAAHAVQDDAFVPHTWSNNNPNPQAGDI